MKPSPEKYAGLRAKYLDKRRALDAHVSALRCKYGDGWREPWISRGERTTLDRLRDAVDKAATAFYAYLTAISPRDWSYGVPVCWLYESLPYEDAIRPVGEALSVVPPLAHGATAART